MRTSVEHILFVIGLPMVSAMHSAAHDRIQPKRKRKKRERKGKVIKMVKVRVMES